MGHYFEVDVAVKYGVNAAVLLNNIYFWCQKNKANKRNYYDGYYWTYNSRNAFTEIFPYLSERQIKTALDKLIEDNVIKTGCYNEDARDRSLWYTLTEKGWWMMQKCQMHTAEMSNANDENVRPLPDINPDGKTSYIDSDGFEDFWKVYPKKCDKSKARKAWKNLKPNAELTKKIIEDVQDRCRTDWKDKDAQYILLPTTYIHNKRWDDERSHATKPNVAPAKKAWEDMTEEERQRDIEETLKRGSVHGKWY